MTPPLSYGAIAGVQRSNTRLMLEVSSELGAPRPSVTLGRQHGTITSNRAVANHGGGEDRGADGMEQRPSSVSCEEWEDVMTRKIVQEGPSCDGPIPHWFSVTMGVLIVLNSIMLGVDTDVNRDDATFGAKVAFLILESLFTVVWIVEMFVRIHYMRWGYFKNAWTLLDLALVLISIVSAWVEPFITGFASGAGKDGEDPSWLRWVRLARVLRLLRLVKLARMFPELWLIINGFIQALRTLGWVLLMLFLVIYTGGIFMTIIVGHDCDDTWRDWDICEELFGTVYKTMYTLFQVMTFESWSMVVARPVIYEKWWLVIFFMSFLMLTSFGLLNIIVGVVVENTLAAANEKKLAEEEEKERKMREELMTLKTIFEEADEDGNGCMDISEFTRIMNRPDVKHKCKSLQLPVEYPERLFEIIDEDDSGEITIIEFIEGAMMLKEAPSNVDMRTALMQIQQLVQKVARVEGCFSALAQEFPEAGFRHAISPTHSSKEKRRVQHQESRDDGSVPSTPKRPAKPRSVFSRRPTLTFGDLGEGDEGTSKDDFDVASEDETYHVPVPRSIRGSTVVRESGVSSLRRPRLSGQSNQACVCGGRLRKLEDSVGDCLSRLQQLQQAVSSLAVQMAANANSIPPSDEASRIPAVSKPAMLAKQGATSKKPVQTLGPFAVSLDVLRCTINVQKQMLGHSEELLRRLSSPSGKGDPRQLLNQFALRQAGIALPSPEGFQAPSSALTWEVPTPHRSDPCTGSFHHTGTGVIEITGDNDHG